MNMAVNTDILILGPFREVVTRAKEAAANAEHGAGQVSHDADPELCKLMIKTSQTLLKEGERALKRIQPLWDSQIERYGDAFARGLSQNGKLGPNSTTCASPTSTKELPHPTSQTADDIHQTLSRRSEGSSRTSFMTSMTIPSQSPSKPSATQCFRPPPEASL